MSQRGLHIGIIPDGSRRWAKNNDIKNYNGKKSGNAMQDVVNHIFNKYSEVSELSLWALSTENLDRKEGDKELVYSIIEDKIKTLMKSSEFKKGKLRVNIVGSRLKELPDNLKELISEISSKTSKNNEKTLNVCIGYGGKEEILDAVMASSRWLRKNPTIAKLHQNVFEKHLLVPKPLDIVIRTGGEKRLSGFMLYQIEYAELFFTDTLWPDFSAKEFDKMFKQFKGRSRRFGK